MDNGIVYLIGAGPGDPGLITVRGQECLAQADVIVYDRLASPELLRVARLDAEMIYVGKASSQHTLSQDEINALLLEKAQAGLQVARLKGGDPFVFGRGGEEAQTLVAAGIPFEIVPGVTSAIAAPAYAGIPITHRGLAASFAVVTGHRRKEAEVAAEDGLGLDWNALAAVDTLVFLMGVANLPTIVQGLLDAGRDPQTPAALVHWGTTSRQETVTGNLQDIVARVQEVGLRPPAVTVVGDVVSLRDQLRWFDARPLLGRRVLVTRSRAQASQLSARLRALGAEPVEFPTIEILPPDDWGPVDKAVGWLVAYDWIIFTSVNGVKYFWQRMKLAGKDARALAGTRLGAIGPATAEELAQRGLQADLVPSKYVAEAILDEIGPVKNRRVLLPRADIARPALVDGLRAAGAIVDEVAAYRTVVGTADNTEEIRRMLTVGEIDVITFTSSSTARNFLTALAPTLSFPTGTTVACIGPVTAQTAKELGLPVHVTASEHTIDGLIQALMEHITGEKTND
ncbi:MAG: uroporphyrinogen-III C-methyltransferase [Chloroflexi bacterium]|nr:uroporphyrinogen-III C-methyltransferase [Chloroflexota bacterium]